MLSKYGNCKRPLKIKNKQLKTIENLLFLKNKVGKNCRYFVCVCVFFNKRIILLALVGYEMISHIQHALVK